VPSAKDASRHSEKQPNGNDYEGSPIQRREGSNLLHVDALGGTKQQPKEYSKKDGPEPAPQPYLVSSAFQARRQEAQ
jgi:hypothetical protein